MAYSSAGQSTSTPTLISPTSDPNFSNLLSAAQSAIPTSQPSLMDVLNQGMSSPVLQAIIGPALQNLVPGEQLARENFKDEFRGAGAMGSGAMAVGSARLENSLLGQQGNLISQIISAFLPTLVSGYGQQINASNLQASDLLSLLGAAKPMVGNTSQSTQSSFGDPYGGLGSNIRDNSFAPPPGSTAIPAALSTAPGGGSTGNYNSGYTYDPASGLYARGGGLYDINGNYVGPVGTGTQSGLSSGGGGTGLSNAGGAGYGANAGTGNSIIDQLMNSGGLGSNLGFAAYSDPNASAPDVSNWSFNMPDTSSPYYG